MVNEQRSLDIRPLKKLVSLKLPSSSMVRRIILREKDIISVDSFIQKAEIWLDLYDEEEK